VSKLTNAELAAKVEQLQSELEAAKAAKQRVRYYSNLWPNNERRTENDPAWQGTIRLAVDDKPVWFDISQWDADPERFKKNPPDFSISMSETPAERAAELETKRDQALKEKANIR